MTAGRVEFVPVDAASLGRIWCVGLRHTSIGDATRYVVIDGMWDGNGVCASEECAAQAIAQFGEFGEPEPLESCLPSPVGWGDADEPGGGSPCAP